MRSAAFSFALLVGASGCIDGGEVALDGAHLLLPDDLEVHWDEAYNAEQDGLGALVPVDVMAYEPTTGAPLAGVGLMLQPSDSATLALPDDAVLRVEPDGCTDCGVLWDAVRDQYVLLGDDDETYAGALEDGWGGGLLLSTDADGVARAHLYVDAFPRGPEGFAAMTVLVSAGEVDGSFELIPR